MASSAKFVCLFFLLTTLLFSLQIYARDSQFFSKVSRERDTTTNPTKDLYNNNVNEAETFSKVQKTEEEPVFTPQTTGNVYGLYGHETGLDVPSTTPTTLYNMDDNKYEYDTKFYDNNIKNEKDDNKFEYDTKFFDNNIKNEKQDPFTNTNNNNEFAQTKYSNNNNEFPQTKYNNNDIFPQTRYLNNDNNERQNSFANNNEFAQTKYFNNNNEKQADSFTNNNELFDENKYLNNNEYDQNKYLNNNNEQYDQEKYFINNNEQYDQDKYLNNNNEKQKAFTNNNLYDRVKNYAPELKGLSEFSYKSKASPGKYVSNNNNGAVEKQGMSDTRYLENGKYYYDINSEKNYDSSNNNFMSYNNNHGEYYKNNYYNGNGMHQGSFKNQFPEQAEFDFDDQP